MAEQNQKVFGVGLGRTGRGSLTQALNDLGIKSEHVNNNQTLSRELLSGSVYPNFLKHYQGIVGGINPFWRQLDQKYPGSKFILTVREKKDWLEERKRMAQLEIETFPRLTPQERETIQQLRERVYGSFEFDETLFLEAYERHVKAVLSHFKARPADLLVMNIVGGDGWKKLCPFLGLAVPSKPFPHKNSWKILSEWNKSVADTWAEIEQHIPSNHDFILVDDGKLGVGHQNALPFLERNGHYWGSPPDNATAISELERMRQAGADFVIFVRESFWWLDYYADFHRYLRSKFSCIVDNNYLILFDLRC